MDVIMAKFNNCPVFLSIRLKFVACVKITKENSPT